MTLEEALKKIEELNGLIDSNKAKALEDTKTQLSEQAKTHDKAIQLAHNKGYDSAKGKFETDKDGFIKKEDVDKMLSDRDTTYSRQSTLSKMGVKNPKRALKLIDEDDLKSFGTEDFKEEDFIKKYGDDIVFNGKKEEEGEKKNNPSNFMKNNDKQKEGLTAEKFEAMSSEERSKLSTAQKLALL